MCPWPWLLLWKPIRKSCGECPTGAQSSGSPQRNATLDPFFILCNKETLFTAKLVFETKVNGWENPISLVHDACRQLWGNKCFIKYHRHQRFHHHREEEEEKLSVLTTESVHGQSPIPVRHPFCRETCAGQAPYWALEGVQIQDLREVRSRRQITPSPEQSVPHSRWGICMGAGEIA